LVLLARRRRRSRDEEDKGSCWERRRAVEGPRAFGARRRGCHRLPLLLLLPGPSFPVARPTAFPTNQLKSRSHTSLYPARPQPGALRDFCRPLSVPYISGFALPSTSSRPASSAAALVLFADPQRLLLGSPHRPHGRPVPPTAHPVPTSFLRLSPLRHRQSTWPTRCTSSIRSARCGRARRPASGLTGADLSLDDARRLAVDSQDVL
jgi:hypothetical protein